MVVYAVCSLEPEECEEQVTAFLARNAVFKRDPVEAVEVIDPQFVTREGDLRTLPSNWAEKGGMDGFFAARLRRMR
jgi:16S rRNA (cytosine967-C5)-methyltransferase